jgi:hypothetical protein
MQYVNSFSCKQSGIVPSTGDGEVLALKAAALYIVHVQYTETL